ncbi:MAG: hypothetical protein ACMUIL_08320 [bacterium]
MPLCHARLLSCSSHHDQSIEGENKETILSNGGDFNDAALILGHYFGAQKCVFLEALPPHIIIPYIDMFFKPVTGNICLLGRYEDFNPDPILEVIQKWCNESLEKDYFL